MAIKDGKIVATGKKMIIQNYTATNTQSLKGAYIYPGFNDAHAHFCRLCPRFTQGKFNGHALVADGTSYRFSKEIPQRLYYW